MIKDDINHDEVIQKFLEKQRKRIKKIRTKCDKKDNSDSECDKDIKNGCK